MIPVSRSRQYILFWYIAETLPPEIEASMSSTSAEPTAAYQQPPRFPLDMTIAQREALEPPGYHPIKHPNTAVNDEEALYESHLLPVDVAIRKLRGTISADVVRRGWTAICQRRDLEEKVSNSGMGSV